LGKSPADAWLNFIAVLSKLSAKGLQGRTCCGYTLAVRPAPTISLVLVQISSRKLAMAITWNHPFVIGYWQGVQDVK